MRSGSGLTPMTGWPCEVFRDVGDQAVLADRDHDVLRPEQEPEQVVAVDVAAPPVGRNRRADLGERVLQRGVPGRDLVEIAAPLPQEERRRRAGAVLGEQLVELAAPGHDHDAWGQGAHDRLAPLDAPLSLLSRPVTRSGVTVS